MRGFEEPKLNFELCGSALTVVSHSVVRLVLSYWGLCAGRHSVTEAKSWASAFFEFGVEDVRPDGRN